MDETLLLWINQGWGNSGLDFLFGWLTSRHAFALPLAIVLLLAFVRHWQKAGLKLWLVMLLVVGTGDAVGNGLKHVFSQHRPCYSLAYEVRLANGVPCGSNPTGMPSNHALNGFAIATFLTIVLRRGMWSAVLFALAALVALSRVYFAKHFPSQILVGAMLGSLWGWAGAWFGLKYFAFMRGLRERGHPAMRVEASIGENHK